MEYEQRHLARLETAWEPLGLSRRLHNVVMRRRLAPADARKVLRSRERVPGLGVGMRAELALALGVSDAVRNTDTWTPEQWGRVALHAEGLGYEDCRLSELPGLVRAGALPHPDVLAGLN